MIWLVIFRGFLKPNSLGRGADRLLIIFLVAIRNYLTLSSVWFSTEIMCKIPVLAYLIFHCFKIPIFFCWHLICMAQKSFTQQDSINRHIKPHFGLVFCGRIIWKAMRVILNYLFLSRKWLLFSTELSIFAVLHLFISNTCLQLHMQFFNFKIISIFMIWFICIIMIFEGPIWDCISKFS